MDEISTKEIEVIREKYLDKRVRFKGEDTDEIIIGTVYSVEETGELKIKSDGGGEGYIGSPKDLEMLPDDRDSEEMEIPQSEALELRVLSHDEALVYFDKAREVLRTIRGLPNLKNFRDKAVAIRAYFGERRAAFDVQFPGAELQFDSECKIGRALIETPKNKGGRPPSKNLSNASMGFEPLVLQTLKELKITADQSSLWRKAASIPEDKRFKYLNEIEHQRKLPTSRGFISHVKKSEQYEEERSARKDPEKGLELKIKNLHTKIKSVSELVEDISGLREKVGDKIFRRKVGFDILTLLQAVVSEYKALVGKEKKSDQSPNLFKTDSPEPPTRRIRPKRKVG